MKIVKDMKIREMAFVRNCNPGDEVYVPYDQLSKCGCDTRHLIIVKVKPVPGNKLQIKYRKRFYPDGNIQKMTVPNTLRVERTRKADRGDLLPKLP